MESTTVHFLNVGHGDCTIIEHPSGRLTMIDINNSKSLPYEDEVALAEEKGLSLSQFTTRGSIAKVWSWEDYYESLLVDPADYWAQHFQGRSVFRYIQTHPDMDHMSGLRRLFWDDGVLLENLWDVNHEKRFSKEDFEEADRFDYDDWLVYMRMRRGYLRDEGDKHKVHYKLMGEHGNYWTEDGLSILSPTADLLDYCNKQENWNNASYIIRLDFGGRRLLLPGDAEKPAWDSVVAHHDAAELDCDLLKAAHHGRNSGYSEDAVDLMDPSIVICSVGKKPSTDASDDYRGHGAEVLSTRFQGTISVQLWADGEVWVFNRKGERIAELPILR